MWCAGPERGGRSSGDRTPGSRSGRNAGSGGSGQPCGNRSVADAGFGISTASVTSTVSEDKIMLTVTPRAGVANMTELPVQYSAAL